MSDLQTKANGAKTVTSATDTKANAKTQNEKKPELKPILETKAEKRLKNFDNFQSLCKKFNFLREKSDDFNAYMIGRDGLKETLTIENTNGQVFEISNSRIIGKIMILCQEELFALLDECEKDVVNFEI